MTLEILRDENIEHNFVSLHLSFNTKIQYFYEYK